MLFYILYFYIYLFSVLKVTQPTFQRTRDGNLTN